MFGMSYVLQGTVTFENKIKELLSRIELEWGRSEANTWWDWITDELNRLARSPTTVSKRCCFPYPCHGQVFECTYKGTRGTIALRVFFQYKSDEQTLVLMQVGYGFF